MILWLNGAFGAGKTTVAYELHRRLERSFVYDPENVGYFLRKNTPQACHTHDFQDMPLWRGFNYQILKEIHKAYDGTIIVPMTLVDPAYYGEIIQRLVDEGVPVVHVVLCASRETILKRLKRRSFGRLSQEAFAVEAIGRCLDYFNRHASGIRLETDRMTVEEIVSRVGQESGLTLLPEKRSRLARKAARLKTAIEHIRR
ncbi:MAG: ATP-binding protein [Oscillospiraceae bacterium]|nr:ATP-binding protein [Oscillospiraceae bacterium]